MRVICWLVLLATILAIPAAGQIAKEINVPKDTCCLLIQAQGLVAKFQDWNQLAIYREENARLAGSPAEKGRVVFLGDAITEEWKLDKYFPGKPYLNRGIAGQTTPQMLVRFYPDVIALHPSAVVILAGVNDIAGNTGPETLEMIAQNFRAMCELARVHGIKVVLGQVLPVSDYTATKQTEKHPLGDIVRINSWIRNYAAEAHAEIADYYGAVVDDRGMLKEGFSEDGAHANDRSYSVMAPVAEAAIERALK